MATIKDVARKANVSKMTVSRVINHPEKVSSELRDLVNQAMKELHYQPNQIAKALASKKTRVIKVYVEASMASNPLTLQFVMGLSKRLATLGYTIVLTDEIEETNIVKDYTLCIVNECQVSRLNEEDEKYWIDLSLISSLASLLQQVNELDEEVIIFKDSDISMKQNTFRSEIVEQSAQARGKVIVYEIESENQVKLPEGDYQLDSLMEVGAMIAQALLADEK